MSKKQTNGNLALEQQRVIVIPAHDELVARKLRVAAYARVSSSSEDQLNSYRVQNQYYSELISSNPDWEMVDIYADEGITGTSVEKREDFQRMMQDCRKGKIDRILVKSISRFARNTNVQCVSFSPEVQQLYQQLADQYTRIVNNGCFGTLSQIEEKMNRCKRFIEQWMEALCNKDFVALLQNRAKYDEYSKDFRLPQFGTWGTIQAEGSDGSIPDGLTKALVGRIQEKQKMLQEFWEVQKWFEELIPSLQTYELTVNPDAEPLSKKLDYEYPNTNNITSRTPLAKFNDFYAIDLETTGLSAARNEIIQIAIIKFRHFQPVEILASYVKPRKGLKPEAAAINHITEDMVADAPYIEQIMQSVDAFIGEKTPIVAHNLQFEYKFLAANGSENIIKKRPLYDTLELSKRIWQLESYSLENVCRNAFKFTPALHNAENDALTCGLLFREICNERIGIPEEN